MSSVPGPTVSQTVGGAADAFVDSHRRREPSGRLRSVSWSSDADVIAFLDVWCDRSVSAVVRRLVGLLPALDTGRNMCVVLSGWRLNDRQNEPHLPSVEQLRR